MTFACRTSIKAKSVIAGPGKLPSGTDDLPALSLIRFLLEPCRDRRLAMFFRIRWPLCQFYAPLWPRTRSHTSSYVSRPHITPFSRLFSSSCFRSATFNQVRRGCRVEQRARKKTSPALEFRPELKGVCLKVGTQKPKKPNSGERKVARVRLSSGKIIIAYIPGEGTSSSCLLLC